MSRPGSRTYPSKADNRRLALLVLLAWGAAHPLGAAVRFEVGGSVRPLPREEALEVRVDVRNAGDQPAPWLTVVGELFGRREEARVADELPPGRTARVLLRFPAEVPRPGVHALLLRLEYPESAAPDATGNVATTSEPAYLLLALGEDAPPAVRIAASPMEIDVQGALPLRIESADGAHHRVRLRALTARGLLSEGARDVDVPEKGAVGAAIALRRAGALRGSRLGLIVVAETVDGPVARTSVTTAEVVIAREPGLLPLIRLPLFVLGGLLVATAVFGELRSPRRPRAVP